MPKAIEDQAFRRLPNLQLPPDLPIKDTLNKAANARRNKYPTYLEIEMK